MLHGRILASLAALLLLLVGGAGPLVADDANQVRVQEAVDGQVEITVGGKPFATYVYARSQNRAALFRPRPRSRTARKSRAIIRPSPARTRWITPSSIPASGWPSATYQRQRLLAAQGPGRSTVEFVSRDTGRRQAYRRPQSSTWTPADPNRSRLRRDVCRYQDRAHDPWHASPLRLDVHRPDTSSPSATRKKWASASASPRRCASRSGDGSHCRPAPARSPTPRAARTAPGRRQLGRSGATTAARSTASTSA